MQLQHQAEEVLASGVALELGGVRIEVAHLATPFAFGWGEVNACGVTAVGLDPEHRDFLAGRGFDALHQFHWRQHAGDLFFHLQNGRIQRAQDLVLKRIGRAGDAHQSQHQPCGDAKKPVQLEQGFLQHVTRRPFGNCHHGAHYAVGYQEAFCVTHKSPVQLNERGRASRHIPCGSEPARESGVSVSIDVAERLPSRAGSLPQVFTSVRSGNWCSTAPCVPPPDWRSGSRRLCRNRFRRSGSAR